MQQFCVGQDVGRVSLVVPPADTAGPDQFVEVEQAFGRVPRNRFHHQVVDLRALVERQAWSAWPDEVTEEKLTVGHGTCRLQLAGHDLEQTETAASGIVKAPVVDKGGR